MATATRAPTSDEAISGTWNGTAGTRYTVVDDYPDTTPTDTLLHGTTAGNLTFGFSAFTLPSNAINISVAVLYYDQKTASQACTSAGRLKVGGTYYNATTHNPATTYTQRTDTWATNPKTSAAWTVAQINGTDGTNPLQAFGFFSDDANPTINYSSVQLQVTYGLAYTLPSDLGKFFLSERNLALYSEQFNDSYWGKSLGGVGLSPVVTANDAAAPDGTLTADKIVFDLNGGTTTSDFSFLTAGTATPSVTGKPYIFSVWLKTTDGSSLSFQLSHNGASVNLVTVTGTWQRFTSTSSTAVDTLRRPRLALRGASGTASFASLHAWGLQWEEGTSITDYDPTGPAGATTTGLLKTRRVVGDLGKFFLPERNLFRWSEQFDNAAWTKSATTTSANVTSAPDGTLTADKLVENTANAIHLINQFNPVAGVNYVFSIFAKAAERTKIAFAGGNFNGQGFFVVFNLSTGTLDTNTGGKGTIVAYANGWYRCSIAWTAGSSSPLVVNLVDATGAGTYTGDGVSGVYLWGAQVEIGTSITDYDPTGPAGATTTGLLKTRINVASAGAYVLDGKAATLSWAAYVAAYNLAADKGTFLIAGIDAGVRHNAVLIAAKGSIVISPVNTVVFRKTYNLVASTRAFNINGIPANIIYSGSQAVVKNLYYQSIDIDPRKSIVSPVVNEDQLVYYIKGFLRIL